MATITKFREDGQPGLSRRKMLTVSSAAVASALLPVPVMALTDTAEEYEPLPWLPGRTGYLKSGSIGQARFRYWSGAKAYRETGDTDWLQIGRNDCLRSVCGALSYPPKTEADIRHQQIGRALLARVIVEYPELPWERDYPTHYGYSSYLRWPRREWFREGHSSRPVLLAGGYAP